MKVKRVIIRIDLERGTVEIIPEGEVVAITPSSVEGEAARSIVAEEQQHSPGVEPVTAAQVEQQQQSQGLIEELSKIVEAEVAPEEGHKSNVEPSEQDIVGEERRTSKISDELRRLF